MSTRNDKSGIRQVAEKAGVSIATVSRVLNRSDKVSPDTRERVLRVLEDSDFRPNAAAKALATSRTRTIAAIIPTLEHSIFAVFLNAIEDELAQAGYSLVIATHGFDQDVEVRRCNEVLRLGAEAIILSGSQHKPDFLRTLHNTGVPCLITSVYQPDYPYPTYGYDNRTLGTDAIRYLAGLGHRHISVVHGPLADNDRMQLRVQGVRDALQFVDDLELTMHEASLGVGGGNAVASEWFARKQLPEACLCLADVLALGVLFEAGRHRVTVPDAFSLMGFEDLEWAAHCTPKLTTIALPAAEMGRAAASALVARLDREKPLDHQLFSALIIERDSTTTRQR